MSNLSDLIRGHTDTIILAHLYGHDSYGYEINKAIHGKSNGRYEFNEATLYGAFRRLEESGCITSYWGNQATGARRRYYRITPSGKQAFHQGAHEWEDGKALLDALIQVREDEKYE